MTIHTSSIPNLNKNTSKYINSFYKICISYIIKTANRYTCTLEAVSLIFNPCTGHQNHRCIYYLQRNIVA